MTLDSRIQNVGTLATEAFKDLKKIQTGEKGLVKTGEEMFDCHINGLLPGDCILLGASSGIGKSETLYTILNKMLSADVNPNSHNYVSLEYSMEMGMLSKVLREVNKRTKKKKSEILTNEFTEEEKQIVRQYNEDLKDNRRYVCQEPVTAKEFYDMTKQFLLLNSSKDACIISIDHLLLFKSDDKKSVLTQISDYINLIRLEFKNVYFIMLSQLNRTQQVNVVKDKDNSFIPNTSMIYGSSTMEHISSYICIMMNAFKIGINSFLKFNEGRYDYLKEHYSEVDDKGKASFSTMGKLFFFVTKTRESDSPYKDLFIKEMDLTEEQKLKMKESVQNNSTSSIAPPIFNNVPPMFFSKALEDARGGEFEDSHPF